MAKKISLPKSLLISAMLTLIGPFSSFVSAGEILGVNNEDVEIPDPGYAVSTIHIDNSPGAVIRSVEVEFLIVHDYWGDLTVWVTNGEGDSYELFDGVSYQDGGELKIHRSIPDFFGGVSVNGTWSLQVWDKVPNLSGHIDYWWIQIQYDSHDDDHYYFSSDGEAECFFSTAVAGSPLERRLDILRGFRDRFLIPSAGGRFLVSLYYRLSPHISHCILRHPMLRKPARIFTSLMVFGLEFFPCSVVASKAFMSFFLFLCLSTVLFSQLGKTKLMIKAVSNSVLLANAVCAGNLEERT